MAQDIENQQSQTLIMEDLKDYYGDEEFVTIATGSRKPIYKAPAVATVITAEEIKAMGARSLDDVLETVAGIHVMPSSLSRLDSIYSIRGIQSGFNPHVLVLMNGTPFANVFNGGHPILFRLPVSAISRVEVIRGPGSAIYGADAFAGVINIITKDVDEFNGTTVGGRVGSFDTHDFFIQDGRYFGKVSVGFSLEWQESEGDKSRKIDSDFQTILDNTFGTNASLAPNSLSTKYDVLNTHLEFSKDHLKWRNWYWRQKNAGQGAGGAQALDKEGDHDENLFLTDLSYAIPLENQWEINLNGNFLHRESDSHFVLLPPGALVPIGSDGNLNFSSPVGLVLFPNGLLGNPGGKETQYGVDLNGTYSGISTHRIRLGAGFKYQTAQGEESKNFGPGVIDGSEGVVTGELKDVTNTPFVFLPDSSRRIWYGSIQDEWQFVRDWELTVGVRYDYYSDFGRTINPRLALFWATRHNLTTKFLYGHAFRAPSFSEQFAINNPIILGNNDLEPEKINTYELSFDYRPTFDLQTVLSLFAYRAKDLIEFIPDTDGDSNTAQNAGDQLGYGFELETNWNINGNLKLVGNYSLQHSEDPDDGSHIPDVPGQKLYLRADLKFNRGWTFSPQLLWVGDRHRAKDDPRSDINDYTLVGATLRSPKFFDHWEFGFSAKNLFDENAREPSTTNIPGDYPMEGRNFWGELTCNF
ncbi:TonB-dependent receptor plug domain-containing protein [Desulfuromonas versatilis]|nr:TonB-dependent receptor [Desulfuromonas versatilis]